MPDDISAAVDNSPYWQWHRKERSQLFVLLFQKQWDAALAHVQAWTPEIINPSWLAEKTGQWTTQEELDNAVQVVTDYVNKQRSQE